MAIRRITAFVVRAANLSNCRTGDALAGYTVFRFTTIFVFGAIIMKCSAFEALIHSAITFTTVCITLACLSFFNAISALFAIAETSTTFRVQFAYCPFF